MCSSKAASSRTSSRSKACSAASSRGAVSSDCRRLTSTWYCEYTTDGPLGPSHKRRSIKTASEEICSVGQLCPAPVGSLARQRHHPCRRVPFHQQPHTELDQVLWAALTQSKISFNASLSAAGLGFIVILGGVILSLLGEAIQLHCQDLALTGVSHVAHPRQPTPAQPMSPSPTGTTGT
jgi:hypothetical protein